MHNPSEENQARAQELDAHPARRFIFWQGETPPPPLERDELGFLAPQGIEESLSIKEVLSFPATLIMAPPWSGKTFLAEQLRGYLSRNQDSQDHSGFGRFFHLTTFESFGSRASPPSWWREWKADSDARACWIIDAVDEDAKRGGAGTSVILDALDELDRDCRLSRLTVLILCRQNEVDERLIARLESLYGIARAPRGDGLRQALLAPLSREEASRLVGDDEAFQQICSLIKRNRLQSIAVLPATLVALHAFVEQEGVTAAEVWRHVLKRLLKDRRSKTSGSRPKAPLAEQFEATARIAAVFTFTASDEIAEDQIGISDITADRVFSSDHPRIRALTEATQDALLSAVFERTARGFRFSQHHVQEWFTAFALATAPLGKLIPLLTDKRTGQLRQELLQEIGLLALVTEHEDVGHWITESNGGVAPRPGAAPWTLHQQLCILDRLLSLADKSVWRLSLGRDLTCFDDPQIGSEIAERLCSESYSAKQIDLLLRVATVAGATACSSQALRLATRPGLPGDVRCSAVDLVLKTGSAQELQELAGWAKRCRPSTHHLRNAVAGAVFGLVKKQEVSWADALRWAPLPGDFMIDMTMILHKYLRDHMKAEDARFLVGQFRTAKAGRRESSWLIERLKLDEYQDIFLRAANVLVASGDFTDDDIEGLIDLLLESFDAFLSHRASWPFPYDDREARQRLFQRIMEGGEGPRWLARSLLRSSDFAWAMEFAKTSDVGAEVWLQILYAGARELPNGAEWRRIRRLCRAECSDVLARFDSQRRRVQQEDRRRREEARQEELSAVKLEVAVEDVLEAELAPGAALRRLSWLCFMAPGMRPQNVVGEWAELAPALQRRVTDACTEGLASGDPTPIPEGSSYPGAIAAEAAGFEHVAMQSPCILDKELIRKWLPAVLVFCSDAAENVISLCWRADSCASRDAVLSEATRQMRSWDFVSLLSFLPPDAWDSETCQALLSLAADGSFETAPRVNVLLTAAAKGADVDCLASGWLESGDPELASAGLNVLLAQDASTYWPVAREQIARLGKPAILRLRTLFESHFQVAVDVAQWTTPHLEELARALLSHFPAESDPVAGEGDIVSSEHSVRFLRRAVVELLVGRTSSDAHDALSRLADEFVSVRERYEFAQAQEAACNALSTRSFAVASPGLFELSQIVRLLDDAYYRVIRNPSDLQHVLRELILSLDRETSQHLVMLHERPKGGKRRRLLEEALQAYIACRLFDRLPGVLGESPCVEIKRESLAGYERRTDIWVSATASGGERVSVIIEVKWSDNPSISTALQDQLGNDYLLSSQISHGIFFVGWVGPGTWRRCAPGRQPKPRNSIEAWQQSFSEQSRLFAESRPGYSIVPVTIDLRWAPDEGRVAMVS